MNNRQFDQHMFWFLILLCAAFAMTMLGCSSMERRREMLQQEHPECFVFHDLTIECPNPFSEVDSSAGFGTSITTEKKRTKKPKRKD